VPAAASAIVHGPTGVDSPYDGLHLDTRDPDYVRSWLPSAELVARLYFRVRCTGVEGVPTSGPMIFVGNHSGGLSTPDTAMVVHAYWSYWGADRPTYALVDPSIFRMPKMAKHMARLGGVAAVPRMAQEILRNRASMLIYPGAGDEAYRPHHERHLVKLGNRSAYVRLAMRYKVPIVPVVCHGGHDTLVVLDDGKERARALGLDRLGLDRLPLTYSWPWGLALGSIYGVPFPARMDIAFGEPIHLDGFDTAEARDPQAIEWCHRHVERRMQAMLDGLVAARGKRMVETA